MSAIRTKNFLFKNTNNRNFYRPRGGLEAQICLNCPLPASKCKPTKCQRYAEEKAKLKRR